MSEEGRDTLSFFYLLLAGITLLLIVILLFEILGSSWQPISGLILSRDSIYGNAEGKPTVYIVTLKPDDSVLRILVSKGVYNAIRPGEYCTFHSGKFATDWNGVECNEPD